MALARNLPRRLALSVFVMLRMTPLVFSVTQVVPSDPAALQLWP